MKRRSVLASAVRWASVCAVATLCAFSTSGGSRAWAGTQDFTLKNRLGVTVREVYLSPHDQDIWTGGDVLGSEVLPDGSDVDIHFSPSEDADMWDLKVVTSDGESHEWYNFNLNQITWIKLYMRSGSAYASHD